MKQVVKMHKKSLVSNSHVTLCRYGGINRMIKQKGNYTTEDAGFHRAPERKGFYAFLYPYVELFLLGGVANGGKGYFDEDSKLKAPRPRRFKAIDGYLWTHLKPKDKGMIVKQKGSWYKMHVKDFATVLRKDIAKSSGSAYGIYRNDFKYPAGLTVKNPYALYSKDHLEVFVCRDTVIS